MKKIILVIYSLISINLYATEKLTCEELFRSATYNFYLENSCKYNKHVSVSISKIFEQQNCTKVFTQGDIKRVTNEVLGSSYKKMNKIGRDIFCKNNKIRYDELEKIY